MRERLVFDVGKIVFEIVTDTPTYVSQILKEFGAFRSDKVPTIVIELRGDGLPDIDLRPEEKVFESEAIWSYYRRKNEHIFALRTGGPQHPIFAIAVFDAPLGRGIIYSETSNRHLNYTPLSYPLSELLMILWLVQEQGMLVHACGIIDNGRGYLFSGNSTHGKTTMARIWEDEGVILNDDRIILRQQGSQIWMYSTPWHGDYQKVVAQSMLLDTIFFLSHAASNRLTRLNTLTSTHMLMTRCFPPLWDAAGMEAVLGVCGEVAQNTPCYELGFVPDEAVIDFIRCAQ